MIITLKRLETNGACYQQVRLFKRRFGSSVRLTKAVCLANAAAFDYGWVARRLFSRPAREQYETAFGCAVMAYHRAAADVWIKHQQRNTVAAHAALRKARKERDTAIVLAFWRASLLKGAR